MVLAHRTRHITLVLEDLAHAHNMNAVLRTSDAFGIQDVHLIESRNRFEVAPGVVRGSHLWLTLHRYRSATAHADCIAALRSRGYRIVVTSPRGDAVTAQELVIDEPIALVLGNEKVGVSEPLLAAADAHLHIPMCGFTESLNVSVAAAICLEQLTARLRNSNIDWPLTAIEQALLHEDWVRKSVPHLEALEKRFRADHPDA